MSEINKIRNMFIYFDYRRKHGNNCRQNKAEFKLEQKYTDHVQTHDAFTGKQTARTHVFT